MLDLLSSGWAPRSPGVLSVLELLLSRTSGIQMNKQTNRQVNR